MDKQPYEPPGQIILTAEVGSTLYGVQGADGVDDLDLMSVVVESPAYVTGLQQWESHVWRTADEGERSGQGDIDHTYHSVRKFLRLACQGNPSILAALFAPEAKCHARSGLGASLQTLAPSIVSKAAIPRYRGYMKAQYLRLVGKTGGGRGARTGARPELVEKYGYDTKFAMHMVRLGLQGCELMRTGRISLPMVGVDREICENIRHGRMKVESALSMAQGLDQTLESWIEAPAEVLDEPDYDAVNSWLQKCYLHSWGALNYVEFWPLKKLP